MRIVAGRLRGTKLASVGAGDSDAHLRPTTDRVRESIFNLLVNGGYGDPITDLRVLDLFAGTGALGLEALSRGAAHVSFVDDGASAQALIRDNIRLTRTSDETCVIARNATGLGDWQREPFDLVFLDPPYGKKLGERALHNALGNGWLASDALIVWEESQPPELPDGFTRLDQRIYGNTVITILEVT